MPRAEWDTSGLPRLGFSVPRAGRTELFIHHTVAIDSDSSPIQWETLAEIKAHMLRLQTIRPDLGNDVPYNFVAFIRPDWTLTVCEGRGIDRTGAHTSGHNTTGLATSFAGNFQDIIISDPAAVVAATNDWLRYEKESCPNLGPIYGHRDFAQTACPGQHLYALKPQWTWAKLEDDMTLTPAQEAKLDKLLNGQVNDQVFVKMPGRNEVYRLTENQELVHVVDPQTFAAQGTPAEVQTLPVSNTIWDVRTTYRGVPPELRA